MTNIQFERGAVAPTECIGNAWTLVSAKFGMYVGMGIITLIMIGCIPILNLFLFGPIMGGFAYVVLRDMRGENVDFGMLFKGFEKFVPLMVIGLIQQAPTAILQILQYVVDIGRLIGSSRSGFPSNGTFYQSQELQGGLIAIIVVVGIAVWVGLLVWNILFQFAIPLAMEHDLAVFDAIKLSFAAAFSNLGWIFLLLILEGLVAILGVLAICLGLLVAIPVIYAANFMAYRQVFPLIERNLNFNPPPPNAYGGNFGSGM